jgi:hypothetical protein
VVVGRWYSCDRIGDFKMTKETKNVFVFLLVIFSVILFFSFLRAEDERRNLQRGRHLELIKGRRYAVWVDCNEATR